MCHVCVCARRRAALSVDCCASGVFCGVRCGMDCWKRDQSVFCLQEEINLFFIGDVPVCYRRIITFSASLLGPGLEEGSRSAVSSFRRVAVVRL
jgi:hypothetical protein